VASAQDQSPSSQSGPLTIEKIQSPFIVAPDYKVTDFNNRTEQLAGAYAGRLFDDALLVGGAGYWMVNGGGNGLAYGGLLVGWSAPPVARLRFGARALVGAGHATVGLTLPALVYQEGRMPMPIGGAPIRFGTASRRIRVQDDFLVLEPQATVTATVSDHVGLNVGASYRLTGADNGIGDRIDGVAGSVGLQFTW